MENKMILKYKELSEEERLDLIEKKKVLAGFCSIMFCGGCRYTDGDEARKKRCRAVEEARLELSNAKNCGELRWIDMRRLAERIREKHNISMII